MADPFEIRIRFTNMLQHLNASSTSAQKAAHFALKYRDQDEDLHSCILEQLEKNSMNNRANVLYFVEHLCELAKVENHLNYVHMVQRDILKIVDHVAPDDGTGAINIKVIRKVLASFKRKAVLTPETVAELEDCLKDRETHLGQSVMDPLDQIIAGPSNGDASQLGDAMQITNDVSRMETTVARPEKRHIEQRIEEERERHKRFREGIWMVNNEGPDDEFQKMWDECSDFGEEDFIAAKEESQERRMCLALQIEKLKKEMELQREAENKDKAEIKDKGQ